MSCDSEFQDASFDDRLRSGDPVCERLRASEREHPVACPVQV